MSNLSQKDSRLADGWATNAYGEIYLYWWATMLMSLLQLLLRSRLGRWTWLSDYEFNAELNLKDTNFTD